MRSFLIATTLLVCSTSQAALLPLVTPLGGSWTDGTTTVEYVESPPSYEASVYEGEALLTVVDNSHVLSQVYVSLRGRAITVAVDNALDFYDGSGQLDGVFSFELAYGGELDSPIRNQDLVFDTYINDTPVQDIPRGFIGPGVYTVRWTVDSVALVSTKRTTLEIYSNLPEPSCAWLLLLGLPFLARSAVSRRASAV